jgi:hypothetical protein
VRKLLILAPALAFGSCASANNVAEVEYTDALACLAVALRSDALQASIAVADGRLNRDANGYQIALRDTQMSMLATTAVYFYGGQAQKPYAQVADDIEATIERERSRPRPENAAELQRFAQAAVNELSCLQTQAQELNPDGESKSR